VAERLKSVAYVNSTDSEVVLESPL
jgi:hypothetical protein